VHAVERGEPPEGRRGWRRRGGRLGLGGRRRCDGARDGHGWHARAGERAQLGGPPIESLAVGVRITRPADERLVPAPDQLELEDRERLGHAAQRLRGPEAVGEGPEVGPRVRRARDRPGERVERRTSGLEPGGQVGSPCERRLHEAAPVVEPVLVAREREPCRGFRTGVNAIRRRDGVEGGDPLPEGIDGAEVASVRIVGEACPEGREPAGGRDGTRGGRDLGPGRSRMGPGQDHEQRDTRSQGSHDLAEGPRSRTGSHRWASAVVSRGGTDDSRNRKALSSNLSPKSR